MPNPRQSPGVVQGWTVGTGHFNMLEVPDQVNAMIDGFRLAAADRARPCFPAPSPDDAELLDAADPTPYRP